MNRILWLVCILGAFSAQLKGQTKPIAAQPKPAVAKTSPYVLKKDFEPMMQDMNARINAAQNAASSVKRDMSGKFDQMTVLDSQMHAVQEILNSASFQIALTSDSLKETRFNMEEFKKETEKNMQALHAENQELMSFLWMLFGGAVLLVVIAFVVTLSRIKSVKKAVQQATQQEAQAIKLKLMDEMKNQQDVLKTELQSVKGRVQTDLGSIKTELLAVVKREKDDTNAQMQAMIDRMGGNSGGE